MSKAQEILSSQPHIIKGNELQCKAAVPKTKSNTSFGISPSPDHYKKIHQIPYPTDVNSKQSKKIFVGGLPPSTTKQVLTDFFSNYGEVEYAIVMTDKATEKPRGFGFIVFKNDEGATNALKDKGNHFILGKWVECKRASPKEISNSNVNNNVNMNYYSYNYNHNLDCASNNYSSMNDNSYFNRGKNINKYKYSLIVNEKNKYKEPVYLKNDDEMPMNLFIYRHSEKSNNSNNSKNSQQNEEDNYENNLSNEINNNDSFNNNDDDLSDDYIEPNESPPLTQKEENDEINNANHTTIMENLLIAESKKMYNNYFNEHIKEPKMYNYFHYKLFDINGEEITKMSQYQNTTKTNLFQSETASTSDKDSSDNNSNESKKENCDSNASSESMVSIGGDFEETQNQIETNDCYGPRINKNGKNNIGNSFSPY